MSVADLPPEQLLGLAFEALCDRAPERLRPLLDPGIRIVTERGEHVGIDAVLAWAGKGYDHLDRRFVAEQLEPVGSGLLGSGRVEYVWRESREVGDSTRAFFAVRLAGGLLSGLAIYDDRAAALADLTA